MRRSSPPVSAVTPTRHSGLFSSLAPAGRTVSKLAATLSNVILPGRCLICGDTARAALCSECDETFWSAEAEIRRCHQCSIRVPSETSGKADNARLRCGQCRLQPPDFDETLALADYRPPLDVLAIHFKFRGRSMIAQDMAQRLAVLLRVRMRSRMHSAASAPYPNLLIPAPLSCQRLASRGYNQAWEITRRVGAAMGIAAEPGLLLRAHTAAQSGLGLSARQRGLSRAFVVPSAAHAKLAGMHIGVIDDVMTSGATLTAIARTLKNAGARRVTNLVVFRTA